MEKQRKSSLKQYRLLAIAMVIFIFASIISGCGKPDDSSQASAGSVKATASAAKTTIKSTSTAKTGATAATGTSAAGTTAAGSESNNVSTADNTENGEAIVPDNGGNAQKTDGSDDSAGIQESTTEKAFDLKGREIKVIVSNLKSNTEAPYEDGSRQGEVRTKMVREAEVKYNCKLVFEQYKSWTILMKDIETSVISGVYYCDVFRMVRAYALPKYEKLNIILPINDYVNLDLPAYKKRDNINGVLYPDKYYAFALAGPLTPIGVFYNTSITEREGIPDIQGIAAAGNWNWDTFTDIAVKLTHDLDGDGIIDQWGVGADNAQTLNMALMRSNLAAMIDITPDHQYVYNLQSPKALKALQFASDLYFTYKVAKVSSVLTDFRNGKAAMYIKDAWFGANLKSYGMNTTRFEIIPDGPDNPGDAYMREQGSHMFFFPSNISDPDAVVNVTSYWNILWDETKSDYLTDEDILMSNALTYFDNEADMSNFIKMVTTRKITYDYIEYFETTGKAKTIITANVFDKIAAERIAPMGNIDAIKYQIQEIIDQTMSN